MDTNNKQLLNYGYEYFYMTTLIKEFFLAERMGSRNLHIQIIKKKKMLPFSPLVNIFQCMPILY